MPLIKRSVEPRNVSRGPGVAGGVTSVQDELEFVSVSTLANVMRQLSSLSVRVDDMFSELNRESVAISRRTVALTERTERLRMKIMQLNPTVEPGHYCIYFIVTAVMLRACYEVARRPHQHLPQNCTLQSYSMLRSRPHQHGTL